MTTSPFGTPVPSTAPTVDEPTAASASRRPLLFLLGGVGAAAVVGAGAFLLLAGGDEAPAPAAVAQTPRGTDTVDPGPTVPAQESGLVTVGSRNPFAAQVAVGGGGAAATAPVVATASSGSSTASTTVSAGSSDSSTGSGAGGVSISIPGEQGPAGKDGADGARGPAGAAGADGADGLAPVWVTLTLRDVVGDTSASPQGTFTVRAADGETTTSGVVVDDQVAEVGGGTPQPIFVTSYEDVDRDDEIDYAVVQIGDAGAQYTVWVGESLPLFGY